MFEATNTDDLLMFRKTFDFDPAIITEVRGRLSKQLKSGSPQSPDHKHDVKFQCDTTFRLLPEFFIPAKSHGWNAVLHFQIRNTGDYSLIIHNGTARSEAGLVGTATCTINCDVQQLAHQLAFIRFEDMSEDDELSDRELEMVAGGKGGACGAEVSDVSACGADYSGIAACGGAACGGAVCVADACGAAACGVAGGGGALCGEAACVAAACGGDASGLAAGGGTACGGAACGAAACGGDACGAAAGFLGGCGAAACGAAACAIDLTVFDACAADACAIDVVPLIPGI
jgi:hypothetical protein